MNAGSVDFNLIHILYFICFTTAIICRLLFTNNSPNEVHVPSIEYDESMGYIFNPEPNNDIQSNEYYNMLYRGYKLCS